MSLGEGGADLGFQIAMCDPCIMHHCQSVEQLFDYHFRITFIPPIVLVEGLQHIPYRDILHSNVHEVIVLMGGVEFDEPLRLPICQMGPPRNQSKPMPFEKQGKFEQNSHLIMSADS